MTDNITLPRAVVEEVRSAIRGFYNKYSDEAVHEDAGRAIAALDAALAEPPAKPEPYTLAELFAQFAAKQRPLDADMAAIINANLDSLYITDEPAAALAEPDATREPATDEQAAAAYDGKRGTRQWVDFRDGWLHAERFHGIRKEDKT
jgi:hypothetical protein